MAKVETNNKKVSELASEEGVKVEQNLAAGLAGIVIPIRWFGMDWQGAANKEVKLFKAFNSILPQWLRSDVISQRKAQRQRPRQKRDLGVIILSYDTYEAHYEVSLMSLQRSVIRRKYSA